MDKRVEELKARLEGLDTGKGTVSKYVRDAESVIEKIGYLNRNRDLFKRIIGDKPSEENKAELSGIESEIKALNSELDRIINVTPGTKKSGVFPSLTRRADRDSVFGPTNKAYSMGCVMVFPGLDSIDQSKIDSILDMLKKEGGMIIAKDSQFESKSGIDKSGIWVENNVIYRNEVNIPSDKGGDKK
jgi:hypothetical protein